jgi:hypothetical protein
VRTLGRCGGGLHQLLKSFARGERGDRFRRNRDRVTCPWVAAFPRLASTEPEASKAPQFYGLSRLQRLHNAVQELRQHRVDLTLWKPRNPLRGAPTAGNKGGAMLSYLPTAGRDIRPRCGASCPFGSLDRGACGLVVGDDPPCCLRAVSIPLGRLPAPAPPPPAALVYPCLMLEDGMPRRQPASSRPDPATAALLQTLHPHAAGIDIGATE